MGPVSEGGMTLPKHPGQSGQSRIDLVAHKTPPIAINNTVEIAAARMSFLCQVTKDSREFPEFEATTPSRDIHPKIPYVWTLISKSIPRQELAHPSSKITSIH